MSNEHDGYGVSAETFQEIIRERKAETNVRAEEKRVKVLKTIRDRKSKSGIHPLDQFPKEVWDTVLDKLEEPKDLGSMAQVHGLFNDLLESRKVRDILFPQVAGLLIQTDLDPLAEFLPLARDLNMRALSKSMRNGIDRWYEDNLLRHLRYGRNDEDEYYGMPTLRLKDPKVVKRLLENFIGSAGSGPDELKAKRFLPRSITITAPYSNDILENEERQAFLERCAHEWNDIRSLLEVIGDQVWHFVYLMGSMESLERDGITAKQMYNTFLECVKLMPNLKWLEIKIGDGRYHTEERKDEVSIASYLANHPFLTLQHLERLDLILDSASIEVVELYEAIFSANGHLRMLHIDGFNGELLERLPVVRLQQIDTFCIGDVLECYFNWHHLILPLVNFQWPLKQIQLKIGLESISFMDIFEVLEKYQTLEHVILHIVNVRISGNLKFLELPNLTELELKFDPIINFQSGKSVQFFFSLQFLLYCKKLKKLRWKNYIGMMGDTGDRKLRRFMTNRECHERMINFRAGYRNLNHSNIWDVFPYLDTVEIESLMEPLSFLMVTFSRIERNLPNDEYMRKRPS